jgi:predicted nucleic-acid-binding protein
MIQRHPSGLYMQTNIFIDLNVILDVFLERKGFEVSSSVIQLAEQPNNTLYISAHMVTTFAYLLENAKVPRQKIFEHIDWLLSTFTTIPVDDVLLYKSLKSNITDFEDAVIEQAAYLSGCTMLITRNIKDFKNSIVKVQTPEVFGKTL